MAWSPSRRAAVLKVTCIASSIAVVAGAVVSVHAGHELALLATFVAILVAAKSGVDAHWAAVDARRGART